MISRIFGILALLIMGERTVGSVWLVEYSPPKGSWPRTSGRKWFPLRTFENQRVPVFETRSEALMYAAYCRLKATPRYRVVKYIQGFLR